MLIYNVWSNDPYNPEILATFTNKPAATEYAERHNGTVLMDVAFNSVYEAETFANIEAIKD